MKNQALFSSKDKKKLRFLLQFFVWRFNTQMTDVYNMIADIYLLSFQSLSLIHLWVHDTIKTSSGGNK